MKLIVCLDERDGMAFNKRRQSRDRVLCEDIVRAVRETGGRLCLSGYSEPLFAEVDVGGVQLCVRERYADEAMENDVCFFERESPVPYLDLADTLIVYRWNRHYPSDLKFTVPADHWRLQATKDLIGSSHPNITKEIYVK